MTLVMKATFPLFEKVGGEERAIELIAAFLGRKPQSAAQIKWRTLRRLPAHAALPLVTYCAQHGITVSYDDWTLVP